MELFYCLLGFMLASYMIPILDGISSWFLTWIEMKKAKLSEIINLSNVKIRQDREGEDTPQRAIGFHISSEEEYEEGEE